MAARSFRTPAARYPADPRAVFVLLACVIAGIPLSAGHAADGTVTAQLEHWQIVTWGVLLVLGGGCTLIGTFNQSVNGIVVEQIGSIAVGGTCLLYAWAIFQQIGWASKSLPALVVVVFGIACFWRWGQLQALMVRSERTAARRRKQRGES